ncbi:hypothetical protein BCR44DRAFT_197654 [Catenaria anguillulae PL171]|uniref:Uncharacterized protein n=1 Tax=Catenaria anguillulae PL171 TaxID=765915 RepID=A0A1Y2HPY3_9FUNG|nr:hypothetical protein BCR44DRAFT_197654 [Catenaria anguillulae PL171]
MGRGRMYRCRARLSRRPCLALVRRHNAVDMRAVDSFEPSRDPPLHVSLSFRLLGVDANLVSAAHLVQLTRASTPGSSLPAIEIIK